MKNFNTIWCNIFFKLYKQIISIFFLLLISLSLLHAQNAREILSDVHINGGVIVHLGCSDSHLITELGKNKSFLVHGLDTDIKKVANTRSLIKSKDMYGRISVNILTGSYLPYAENLINLIVVTDPTISISGEEITRVLTPGGTILLKNGCRMTGTHSLKKVNSKLANWTKFKKQYPADMDEWTHSRYDAGANAVANDLQVGPPRHLRWTDGPIWARSHGWTPSVSAMVSSGGKLFYITDETLIGADSTIPNKWALIARDAFNGILLWKVPIQKWGSKEFSGTPDSGKDVSTVGRFTMPPHLNKRLIAIDNTVYVTLGPQAPITAIDAITGNKKQVFSETAHTDEILYTDGKLIISLNTSRKINEAPLKYVCAVNPEDGKVFWKNGPYPGIRSTEMQDPFGRLELVAGDGKAFVLSTEMIICLSINSGDLLWEIKRPAISSEANKKMGHGGIYEYLLETLTYNNGGLFLAQPEPDIAHSYHTLRGALYAFNADNGKQMWKKEYGHWGHHNLHDIFVIGDMVWSHAHARDKNNKIIMTKAPKKYDEPNYRIQAFDLKSGKLVKEHISKDIFNVGHHHRCYPNNITTQYLLSSRRGIELIDLKSGENYVNHWVRSGCLLGYLPCNGLLYVTPHPCGCYINALLSGFNALSSSIPGPKKQAESLKELKKGPAFGKKNPVKSSSKNDEWPTYRHDPLRSGATESQVNTEMKIAWKTDIPGKLNSLISADDKIFTAGASTHTVYAHNANTGKKVWEYTAGARIDSPPTFYKGMIVFGSTDGYVYCLRASDGMLIWRFSAAPQHRLITSFSQLESVWPVSGSVLVHNDQFWFSAGRSSYLDGGIYIYALNPKTGKVLYQNTVYSPDPKTGKMKPEPSSKNVPGLLNDILISDGTDVFIRQMNVTSPNGKSKYLYTSGGFRDSTWFNRTFWNFGKIKTTGLMVMGKDADTVFGVEIYSGANRDTLFSPGENDYRLMCLPVLKSLIQEVKSKQKKTKSKGKKQKIAPLWEQKMGIRITAMIRADKTIFIAGAPDIIDPDDPHAAWEGRKGGVLAAFSSTDGKKLAEYKLPSPPVWDGMASAYGNLYIACMNGSVVCLK